MGVNQKFLLLNNGKLGERISHYRMSGRHTFLTVVLWFSNQSSLLYILVLYSKLQIFPMPKIQRFTELLVTYIQLMPFFISHWYYVHSWNRFGNNSFLKVLLMLFNRFYGLWINLQLGLIMRTLSCDIPSYLHYTYLCLFYFSLILCTFIK